MTGETRNKLVQLVTAEVLQQIGVKQIARRQAESSPSTLLEGVVTAKKLEGLQYVSIGRLAIVTPAAKDYIRDKKITVVQPFLKQKRGQRQHSGDWQIWISPVSKIDFGELHLNRNVFFPARQLAGGDVITALREMNQAVQRGTSMGGVIIDETSVEALLGCRELKDLFPMVGTSQKTVDIGVQKGANMLIMESAMLGKESLSQFVHSFIDQLGNL